MRLERHQLQRRERLVFPLDVSNLSSARDWIARLGSRVGVYKVGLELFTAVGPDAVKAVLDTGARCFLDLKLHDIPETMAGAAASASEMGVDFLTIHASAGPHAVRRVSETLRGTKTLSLAVTVLTSLDEADLSALQWAKSTSELVPALADVAVGSGADGLVCSANELSALRERCGSSWLVVPGLRPEGSEVGDQKRVATPRAARAAGADLLVVGRPIRTATDPVGALERIIDSLED